MSADLVVRSRARVGQRLHELVVHSPALGRDTPVRVVVPELDAVDDRELPVLWLLHGGDDDYRSWTDSGQVEQLVRDLDLVVVMPDCGPGGWYSDWQRSDGPAGAQRWETYHLGELRRWVESELPVRRDRHGRAIAGLSMGGYGAMKYAARHPDQFCFAAAFSGAVDIVDPHLGLFADAMAQLNGGEPGDIWGPREQGLLGWRTQNPVDLAANLASLQVELRTGDGRAGGVHGGEPDLIETTVHQTSTTLHQRLDELGVAHLWDDYGAGAHAWPYWTDALERSLVGLQAAFASPAEGSDEPGRVHHVLGPGAPDAWGWTVRIRSAGDELARLDGTPHSWTLRGRGNVAAVRTPPVLAPGARHELDVGGEAVPVVADELGRLVVEMDLGEVDALHCRLEA